MTERKKKNSDDVRGSYFELLQRVSIFLQPSSLLFRCPQTVHRSPSYSSRYTSLSQYSVWLLRKPKFYYYRNRFCIFDLRAMSQSPSIERKLRSRASRFHVVRHCIFRRTLRSLQRIVQEESDGFSPTRRSSKEPRLRFRYS